MVDKIDPILLLIGSQPEQKIRQICQEEMVRYGVIDSYSVSSNRRGHGQQRLIHRIHICGPINMKLLSTYSEFLLDFLLDCKILKNKSIRSPMLRSCKALRNLLGSRMSLSEHFQVRKLERVVCSNISGFEYSIHKVNHWVSHSYLLSLKSFLVQRQMEQVK